jgi:predicted peptidase
MTVRRSLLFVVLGLVGAASASAQSPEPAKERFQRGTFQGASYRLFVPAAYDGKTALPLVLYLHGGAGRGRDNERHLRDGNGMIIEMFAGAEKQFPAFVLAPQTATTHDPATTFAILDDVRARYRVDPTRLYVVGQSLGGYGLIDLIGTRPQLFAAAVVIAASGDRSFAKSLAGVPIWFFHGEHDEGVPVEGVRRLAGAVKRAGGTVRYTEYAGEGHGLAWIVVKEPELVPWVFEQRRAAGK